MATRGKGYLEDPEIRATADFIKNITPHIRYGKRRWLIIDRSIFPYIFIGSIILLLLIMMSSVPPKTIEITRTTVEIPIIEEDVKVTGGSESEEFRVGWEGWWNISLNTSCEGIESFYMEGGFMSDWENMMDVYDKIYSSNGEEEVCMKPPIMIIQNSTNYDCEDFAHATRCLAEYYDVNCSFWIKEYTGPVVPDYKEHLGVCCDIGEGEWRCV